MFSTFASSLPRSFRYSVPASFGTLFYTAAYTTPLLAILAERMLSRVPRISPISNLICPIFLYHDEVVLLAEIVLEGERPDPIGR